ncbi:hypothetical protein AX15_004959 [Amanita polypyramis BW_CC]|nr:hypothetical protein AX15_004959 [Amanita polypyramis BW_CC]
MEQTTLGIEFVRYRVTPMSSRSSSPELPTTSTPKTSKKAKKPSGNAPRNEGIDPSWPFVIPPGYTLFEGGSEDEGGEFDWDTIKNNPNLELWLMRIPSNLQPKHLDLVSLSLSSSRGPSKIGELSRKHATYNIWSCDVSQPGEKLSKIDGDESLVCGEEMNSVTCLLPRKSKKNALYAAPKPISRHIVVTAQPAQPQLAPDASGASVTIYQNPPRQSYPLELLKHRFTPYGSLAPVENDELGQKDKGTEDHKRKRKTKSKDKTGTSMVLEASEISAGVDMDVDVTFQSFEKKDKKEKKEKKIKHDRVVTGMVSQAVDSVSELPTSEESKANKKRKGAGELTEAGVERKKSKKLKTKAV